MIGGKPAYSQGDLNKAEEHDKWSGPTRLIECLSVRVLIPIRASHLTNGAFPPRGFSSSAAVPEVVEQAAAAEEAAEQVAAALPEVAEQAAAAVAPQVDAVAGEAAEQVFAAAAALHSAAGSRVFRQRTVKASYWKAAHWVSSAERRGDPSAWWMAGRRASKAPLQVWLKAQRALWAERRDDPSAW